MARYWLKIAFGAVLIFTAGMLIRKGVHMGVNTVHVLADTADPITIPIRFINFRVDGAALGRLEQLTLLRTAPKAISSVEVTVRVDSAAAIERLRHCTMRIDDLEHIDEHTSFVCVDPATPATDGAFEPFGSVAVKGTDLVMPLLLPAATVRDLQHQGWQGADSMAPTAPPAPPEVPHLPSPKATVTVP